MKRTLLLVLLALALPMSVFASSNSVDFTNGGGTLTGSNSGLSLSGSTLIAVNGLNGLGLVMGNLGSVTFSTASFATGSASAGGTLNSGGSFVIWSNGSNGLPSGNLFSGSFTCSASDPCTWVVRIDASGNYHYYLTADVSGTWYNGSTVSGTTIELTFSTGKNPFNGTVNFGSGDTDISTTTPEPGTLGLLGTGLIGMVGMLRRKLKG